MRWKLAKNNEKRRGLIFWGPPHRVLLVFLGLVISLYRVCLCVLLITFTRFPRSVTVFIPVQ